MPNSHPVTHVHKEEHATKKERDEEFKDIDVAGKHQKEHESELRKELAEADAIDEEREIARETKK